ncbi:ferredoxin [Streptomyces sp. NBC_01381]|uniref:ferredoxin n=1 Tax=unclassified Streptomyces TaxID=2593676 RepID=UPI00224F8F39|nr:ferredoxin [Streptomyces sp. NBC_01381]MCX4669943.1 ferredoxin [Streptomyces sp. NBC_01381]
MHITVNRELCAGSGNCVVNAPEVFDQDDTEGLVLLRVTQPPADLEQSVELAAQLCPVGAIDVVREAIAR